MKQKLDLQALKNVSRARRKGAGPPSAIEQNIVSIQNHFLSPGMHCITVPTHLQGRSILRVCLDSLCVYSDVGMLTAAQARVPGHYRDIHQEIDASGASEGSRGALEDYMLTALSCDFLILEYTEQLMKKPWFGMFEQLLHEYGLVHAIPVIMFMYDDHAVPEN